MRFAAVLFDLDGVLVDSAASVESHWRTWAETHGLDADLVLATAHGHRSPDTIRKVAPELDHEAAAAAMDSAQANDTSGVSQMTGAAELLAVIGDERWAVVTSGTLAVATARLEAAGLAIPEVLITADRVRAGKPDPEGYREAARLLGVAAERTVVVEDAPSGIAAGKAAGMHVVGITTTHAAEDLVGADEVVETLAEVQARLISQSSHA